MCDELSEFTSAEDEATVLVLNETLNIASSVINNQERVVETWRIDVLEKSALILSLERFRLPEGNGSLTLFEGESPTFAAATFKERITAHMNPIEIVSFTPYFWIRFESDNLVNNTGFSANLRPRRVVGNLNNTIHFLFAEIVLKSFKIQSTVSKNYRRCCSGFMFMTS